MMVDNILFFGGGFYIKFWDSINNYCKILKREVFIKRVNEKNGIGMYCNFSNYKCFI